MYTNTYFVYTKQASMKKARHIRVRKSKPTKSVKENKTYMVKFRVSESWLDAINYWRDKSNCAKGMDDSKLFRWLILEGALKYISSETFSYYHSKPETWSEERRLLQAEIEKKK